VQRASLDNLVRSIPQLIAEVTDFMTLYPGDVLLVGAAHDAPLARAGDSFSVEIDGVGHVVGTIA
jgi:5-oxopent-3-ene-1,2,5-tricarboxylate decarboxylase/2-hydroxyhepta-2,4-diene-1,7-dioate isomerase